VSSAAERLYREGLDDFRAGNLAAAEDKLKAAVALDPRFEDAREAHAVILFNQKRYDEAVGLIKAWILLNPDSVMARVNLSRCYAAKGMIMEAEHEQAEARRLTWKADLKSKKTSQPRADPGERIARYKEVIQLDPADVLGYYSLGSVYLEAGMKREALDTFERAVAVDPAHSASYLGLGQALEGLGDTEGARKAYTRGIETARKTGDMMPQKKMESRLRALEGKGGA
jgi:tetratricopeptide (TPR) repeat protein